MLQQLKERLEKLQKELHTLWIAGNPIPIDRLRDLDVQLQDDLELFGKILGNK